MINIYLSGGIKGLTDEQAYGWRKAVIKHYQLATSGFGHTGMTQEELALRTGVSRQTIMSIERGQTNPSVLLAFKIAAAFNVSVTETFSMEGTLVPV